MRRLNRIVLVNSAGFDYVEFPVGGHSQVIGVNGHGKSTLLRTVLFFYLGTNEKAPYALHETKTDFVSHYLGDPPSYLIYEVARGNGEPDYHIAVTRPAGRIQFHFIDAPFCKDYYVDGNVVQSIEAVSQRLRDANCDFDAVTSYDEFHHRIYGLVPSPYTVFRPAPRSSGHVGILPRIISGIFTVSQLDADKLKSALTCGVRQDSLTTELDLVLLKNQLENFRRVNNAVKTYLRHEQDALDLVALAEQFETIKSERQHAIEDLVRMAKRLPEEWRILTEQQTTLAKERTDAAAQFELADGELRRAIQKLGEDLAVLNSKIVKGEETEAEYRKREIERKSKELEKLPGLNEEGRSAQEEYDALTAKYGDEQQRKERMSASVQQTWTELSRQIAEKKAACERESLQHLKGLEEERTQALAQIEEEQNQAKNALRPKRKCAEIDRAALNQEFKDLADINEPAELVQLRTTLADTDSKLRDEASRQERLRSQIALAKEKSERERERIDRDAVSERTQLEATIKQLEESRDRMAAELEKLDGSLARFFQVEAPQTWSQASKTLKRETLFQSAAELEAKKSPGNAISAWGLEFSTEKLPESPNSYDREALSGALQRTKEGLAIEHDKLQAARERYLAATSELDKLAAQARNSLENEVKSSIELRRNLQDQGVRLENRRLTLDSQFKQILQTRRTKLSEREIAVKQEEDRVHQDEIDLEERHKGRRNKLQEDLNARRKSFEDVARSRLSGIAEEEQAAQKKRGEELARVEQAFQAALTKQGVNVVLIKAAQERAANATLEIQRISGYQTEVTEYGQLKREFIDPLPSLKSGRARLLESAEAKKSDQKQLKGRHEEAMQAFQMRQDNLEKMDHEMQQDRDTVVRFRNDARFAQELSLFDRDDLGAAPFYRAKAISELTQTATDSHESLVAIGTEGEKNARTFLNHFDPETLDRKVLGFSPIHPHFNWFIFVGTELRPFVNKRGIQGMKQIQTQEFEQLIRNICAKNSDFREGIRQVNQTANLVEQHLKENNFVDVLDAIELKVERIDSSLTRILAQLEEFAGVTFSADRDLFGKRADRDQIDRAIETFEKLLREIDNHRVQRLQLADYFDFVIRVHENGHDMGWRKSLDHIGSTGTDYLVKMLIYLSLIEIYRERAIDAKAGSTVHCVLDETGVLAPRYVRSVLEYAQSRGIILITAGHSQQTVGFQNWMHVRKCGQRFAAQTVLRKVMKCD
jgi:Protein of unknown function (DUF3584)